MHVRMRSIPFFCLVLRLSLTITPLSAQQQPDSALIDRTATSDQAVLERLGPDSRLYNGHEYIRIGTPATGFPFFGADSLQTGWLSYDGTLYRDIAMEYDLVLDELIIHDYTGKALISLIGDKISYFSIGTHRFRFLVPDRSAATLPKSGFYEELYHSKPVTLLARREKKLFFPSNNEERAGYSQQNFYFLSIGNSVYRVGDKAELLAVLKDKKPQLKKYIREHKLRFSKQFENALLQITIYYHQISY